MYPSPEALGRGEEVHRPQMNQGGR
jgi:hypothetical protein